MDSTKGLPEVTDLGSDNTMKRAMDSMTSAAKMAELTGSDSTMKRAMDSMTSAAKMAELTGFARLGIDNELKRAMEHTSFLARDVDVALSNIRIPASAYQMPSLEVRNLDVPPNPVWETNRQLAELTDTVTQLVDVARQQAELSQAIRNASDLALKNAIQSGDEAKSATQLARKSVRLTFGAIIVAIIIGILNVGVTVYENRRQEEIRVLREISSQLKELNRQAQGNPAIKP